VCGKVVGIFERKMRDYVATLQENDEQVNLLLFFFCLLDCGRKMMGIICAFLGIIKSPKYEYESRKKIIQI